MTSVSPVNGNTYHLIMEDSWQNSQAEAVTLGGNLATIRSSAEQDWVFDTFSSASRQFLWIGLNDAESEGSFVWASGESSTYTNWIINEPNNQFGNEHYAHMWHGFDGQWNDANETHNAFGVVEVSAVPEPSGLLPLLIGSCCCLRRRRA